jgi:hypothetical protein
MCGDGICHIYESVCLRRSSILALLEPESEATEPVRGDEKGAEEPVGGGIDHNWHGDYY